jgi:uncharacterized protein YciI
MTTRVTRDEVLEASGEMLKKQFYVVFTTPTNGIGPVMENLPVHLAHQREIERLGILVAAGPHWTDDEQWHVRDPRHLACTRHRDRRVGPDAQSWCAHVHGAAMARQRGRTGH